MTKNTLGGFIVNLMQDVNILRPLIYITADDIGIKPFILVTKSLIKVDQSKLFIHAFTDMAAFS